MTHRIDIGGNQGRGDPVVGHELDDDGREADRPHLAPAFWYAVLAWVSVCELAKLIKH